MAIHIPIWLIVVTCVATVSTIITTLNNDTGYKPKKSINDAIIELKKLYEKKVLIDKPNFHSIQWLKHKLQSQK